jgi:regulation of enolase protein 1 (concanavalin A-like superfamily)
MVRQACLLSVVIVFLCACAASPDEFKATPNEVPGWGRVLDPWRDCGFSFDVELDRLKIQVPGTPHVLSAEVPELPMNAPRVMRRVRGDFTARVHVLGQFEPGRSRTTHYEPYHGAGLIICQDASNYLRLEQAVGFIEGRHLPYINYELREDGRLAMTRGIKTDGRSLFVKLGRHGGAFAAWYSHDGRRWIELGTVDTSFAERVEVGVVAVNSSQRALSAEMEHLSVEDPLGSVARDYGGRVSQGP